MVQKSSERATALSYYSIIVYVSVNLNEHSEGIHILAKANQFLSAHLRFIGMQKMCSLEILK